MQPQNSGFRYLWLRTLDLPRSSRRTSAMTVHLHRRLTAPTSPRWGASNQYLRPCPRVPAANRLIDAGGVAGFSLVEMLVAVAVFSIAATVAFVLYSTAARSYRTGVQLILEQQNVRTGFDRMISEIRMAGFDSNPRGTPDRKSV